MIPLLVEVSVRVLVVAAVAGLLLMVLRIRSGAAKHAAWTAVLATMLAAPLLVWWGAALPVAIPRLPSVEQIVPTPSRNVAPASAIPPAAAASTGRAASLPAVAPISVPAMATVLPRSQWSWSSIILAMWVAGAALPLALMLMGWRRARTLVDAAESVAADRLPVAVGAPVWESSQLAVPVAVGIVRPRIILPTSWSNWSREDLTAALVHEQAHITRRDLFVSFLARLNQAVYWFHPLAWFLSRAIARSSEEACDDVVMRRMGDDEHYADLLVSMASAVQQASGRTRWTMAGMAGGRLEARIDRVLAGHAARLLPRGRALMLTAALFATAVSGIACQQQPAALEPNPIYTARLLAREERARHLEGAGEMTREQVTALEAEIASAPDDLKKVERLLSFYRFGGQKMFGWNEMIARRRPHLLRVIERHPASRRLAFRTVVRGHDPEGYDAASAIWLRHVEKVDVTPAVLGNAAEFFRASDKPRAEELLKRALAMDPEGPQPRLEGDVYHPSWRYRLGSVYAQALVGATDDTLGNVVASFSPAESRSVFAAAVRRTLEATTDVEVLVTAGRYLMQQATPATGKLDFDHRALGRAYIDRALVLAPNAVNARRLKMTEDIRVRHEQAWRVSQEIRDNPGAFKALTEDERFSLGGEVATSLLMRGEGAFAKDPALQAKSHALARQVAEEALALSARHRQDEDFGTAVLQTNMVLGQLALAEGDRGRAVQHLRAAVDSSGSPQIDLGLAAFGWRLPIYLLNVGERESVIAFFERMAELDSTGRERWRADAKAVRSGQMTESYQSVFGGGPAAVATR